MLELALVTTAGAVIVVAGAPFLTDAPQGDTTVERLLLLGLAVAVIYGVLLAALLYAQIGAPLRAIRRACGVRFVRVQ